MTDNVSPDGSEVDQLPVGDARGREPITLSQALTHALATTPADARRRPALEAMRDSHDRTTQRRLAVLKYPDLCRRLESEPLNFTSASQWNGYIPPYEWPVDDSGELLRSPLGKLNQRSHYTQGTQINDSPERASLMAISREAYEREHAA